MALVSRIRTRRVRQVSSAAEACETRSLLCAAAVSLAAVEFQDSTSNVANTTDAGEVAADDVVVDDGSASEIADSGLVAICTMMPIDGVVDETTVEPLVSEDVGPFFKMFSGLQTDVESADGNEDFDPSLLYSDVMNFADDGSGVSLLEDGSVMVKFWHDLAPGKNGEVVDDVQVDEQYSGSGEDVGTAIDGWDPSWAYRSLTGATDDSEQETDVSADCDSVEVVDVGVEVVDVTKLDGYDPSWAYRSLIGGAEDDSAEVAVVDDGVVDPNLTDDGVKVQNWYDLAPSSPGDGEIDGGIVADDGSIIPPEVMYTFGGVDSETTDSSDSNEDGVKVQNWHDLAPGSSDDSGSEASETDGGTSVAENDSTTPPEVMYTLGGADQETTDSSNGDVSGPMGPVVVSDTESDAGTLDGSDATVGDSEVLSDVIYYSLNSVSGVEVESSTADTPTFGVSAADSSSIASLFQSSPDLSSVGTQIASPQVSSVESATPTNLTASPSRSKSTSLVASTSNAVHSELDGLNPLLEGDDETTSSPESDSSAMDDTVYEDSASVSADKDAKKAQIASARVRNNQAAVQVAKSSAQQAFNIDQFMKEFAQDSFMS